jgi:hypothetical protein
MGKFSVTTQDRSTVDLEKTFALDGTGLGSSKKKNSDSLETDSAFAQQVATLKKIRTDRKPSQELKLPEATQEATETLNVPAVSQEALQLINALMHTQNHIVQELTDVFDRRLEKFDEIIMDLIRCKTENERLKQKNDNLTRDNYKLKKEVESYRSVVPGLYIKKELDKTKF